MPEGTRFTGPIPTLVPAWQGTDFPADADLDRCVACGLCLPHCPTYRLTGEESASPRGRIAAMRLAAEGRTGVGATFARFMDLCLQCRACEDACPSHVPFGRMMKLARVQIEPLRRGQQGLARPSGLGIALAHPRLLTTMALLQPLVKPFLNKRLRALLPPARLSELSAPLPRVTEPTGEARGTVAVLSGCVQDRWYRPVNRATICVLARNGWRVVVPRTQVCCGALQAHNGRLDVARKLANANLRAFEDADVVVANAAGCGAHLKEYGELLGTEAAEAFSSKVRDLMEFLFEEGIEPPTSNPGFDRVAYHDACHALHAQHVYEQPRALLRQIPDLDVLEIADGDRCCGGAGLYSVVEPQMSDELMRLKAYAIAATGARVIASSNPGCTMQIAAGLRMLGSDAEAAGIEILHPVEILDRAYSAGEDHA
ncbi:MAG: (Fe-S)-binding protein [Actinomycetota bacterium]